VSLSNGGRKKPLPTQEEIDSYQTYMNSEDWDMDIEGLIYLVIYCIVVLKTVVWIWNYVVDRSVRKWTQENK
jgi:hypothetical protein